MYLSLLTYSTLSLFLLIITSIANPNDGTTQQRPVPSIPLSVEVMYQFPPGTWIENLAVGSNGLMVATSLFAPEIYQVNAKTHTGSLVAEIPAATGLLGIVEIEKNVFYVVAANISATLISPTAGDFAVWRVDLNTFNKPNNNNKALAKVEKVVDIPQAKFLNGATVLSRKEGTLLIADSVLGAVFRVNTRSKEVKLVIEDPLFGVSSAAAVAVGINGIKLDRNGDLYFTNSNQNLLGKIPIQPDGTAKAKGQVLSSSGIESVDDFAVGPKVGFFVAQNGLDRLAFVPPAGGNATILVRSTDQPGLKGPTSAAIGKGKGKLGRESLYVGTNGGLASYLSGNATVGGTISRLDIGEFYHKSVAS